MANVSAQEQLMLELVNRARMDPLGEAARFGTALNAGLPAGTITATPKEVLAMNDRLVAAADGHSLHMLTVDKFAHQGIGNGTPSSRITAAGYANWNFNGENISWTGSTAAINPTTAIVEQHRGLFLSSGHRTNILGENFNEVGIGQQLGKFLSSGTNWNASMVTQNFAQIAGTTFITGTIFNDTVVNDNFYSVGEGRGGVVVTATGGRDTSNAAGGYEISLTPSAQTVVIGGVTLALTLGATNVKLDLVNGTEIWTNESVRLVAGAVEGHLLGIGNEDLTAGTGTLRLYGNAGANKLIGNAAVNRLEGGAGNDTLNGAAGADTVIGGAGNDTIYVDNVADVVIESSGGGTDWVLTSVNYVLRAGNSVERLSTTSNAATGTIHLSGNEIAQTITGNNGVNKLSGLAGNDTIAGLGGIDYLYGGQGNDRLIGGLGNDQFVFHTALNATTNRDTISDFHNVSGDNDTIRLENAVFTKLAAVGTLSAAFFKANASGTATDANDYIIYNTSTGALSYDSNGNAAGGAIQFAVVSGVPLLTPSDFIVI
jgi:serralysin